MIVLTQKIAGGLYLHNWLHDSKQFSSVAHNRVSLSQANCTCIDDFYVPFTEPVIFSPEAPVCAQAGYFSLRELTLPVIVKYFHSLRAPPASTSFFS